MFNHLDIHKRDICFFALLIVALIFEYVALDMIAHETRIPDAVQCDCEANNMQPTNFMVREPEPSALPSMAKLMLMSGTDKLPRHAYDRYYDSLLSKFRLMDGVAILEIGADHGSSLQLWADYFSNPGAIHSIAYNAPVHDPTAAACSSNPHTCSRMKIFQGDQSDVSFLKSIREGNNYDIIVDDGSHHPPHQLISFVHLFPCLNPGGIYVIEDVETSYWSKPGSSIYGYSLRGAGIASSPPMNAVEKFKQLVDVLMRYHMGYSTLSVLPMDDQIFSITFGQGLIIITKSTTEQLHHAPYIPSAPVDYQQVEEWRARAVSTNPP